VTRIKKLLEMLKAIKNSFMSERHETFNKEILLHQLLIDREQLSSYLNEEISLSEKNIIDSLAVSLDQFLNFYNIKKLREDKGFDRMFENVFSDEPSSRKKVFLRELLDEISEGRQSMIRSQRGDTEFSLFLVDLQDLLKELILFY